MGNANFATASQLISEWIDSLTNRQPPTRWACGLGELAFIDVRPGRVILIGGAPGAGKTVLATQLAVDGLRLNSELRTLIANVEVATSTLLDRTLARLSGVDMDVIGNRQLSPEHAERIDAGLTEIESVADRLAFLGPPFALDNVFAAADDHEAELIVLDYLQRFKGPDEHNDKRREIDSLMAHLRRMADVGAAVVVVSAVGRQRDAKGRSSYGSDALGLSSFRESSELEFGCDDAYMLGQADDKGEATLRHLKARHGKPRDISLRFNGRCQSFTASSTEGIQDVATTIGNELFHAWNQQGGEW